MFRKKLGVFGIFLFVIILILGMVSAGLFDWFFGKKVQMNPADRECSVVERASCQGEIVLGLSANINAHAQKFDASPEYDYVLCCNYQGFRSCDETNSLLQLSSTTNAHVSVDGSYDIKICYENFDCVIEDVAEGGSCSGNRNALLSVSAETNAHVGNPANYLKKICCNVGVGYFCGDGFVNSEANEECDVGADNGVGCVPEYSKNCTYCGGDCKYAIVVGGFCGDRACQTEYETPLICPQDCFGDDEAEKCSDYTGEGKEICESNPDKIGIYTGLWEDYQDLCQRRENGAGCVWVNSTQKCVQKTEYEFHEDNPEICVEEPISCNYEETKIGDCDAGDEFLEIIYAPVSGSDASCEEKTKKVKCLEKTLLPFFGFYGVIMSLIIISLIYVFLILKREEK